MPESIDWDDIAEQIGLGPPWQEASTIGTRDAQLAIELALGEDAIKAGVDSYLRHCLPAGELFRTILRLVRSPRATDYCYQRYRQAEDAEGRRDAVELLRSTCGAEGLRYLPEFLDDRDEAVQMWGAYMLPELTYLNLDEEDGFEELLERVEAHPSENVREAAARVRQFRAVERGPQGDEEGGGGE